MCECPHTTSAFFRSNAITTVADWYKLKNKLFTSKQEEIITPTTEKQQKKQLIMANIPVTVSKYFLNNLRNPTIAVRLWTANWSIPMVEDLYTNIRTQQYHPTYFSTVIHLTIQQTIIQISQLLAEGLIQIWKCKAATITPINKPPSVRKRTPKKITTTSSTPVNTITKYLTTTAVAPVTSTSISTISSSSTIVSPSTTNLSSALLPTTSSRSNTATNNNLKTQPSLLPFLTPLSANQSLQLHDVFQPPFDETIICTKFDIPITRHYIQCFNPLPLPTNTKWLNDEVINYYLSLLKDKFSRQQHKLHIFTTYFMEKLSPTRWSTAISDFNYNEVSSWTHSGRKNINLFQKDMVIIPINYHNQHWTLAAIYPKTKKVAYYDSMRSAHTAAQYLHIIKRYLQEEARITKTVFDATIWSFDTPTVPQQTNCHDCGVYLLLFAHLITHELPILSINPDDMLTIRKTICNSILNNSVPSTNNVPDPPSSEMATLPTPITTTKHNKRKTAYQGSYNEDHLERKQRNEPTEFTKPHDLHYHPTDTFANRRAGIATSRIAEGGRGLFVTRDFEPKEIIGYMFGGVKLTKDNLHLHLPSLYAFFDYQNNIYIDPYEPTTEKISCSAAYANDNIQNPELNNAEFVTFSDGRVALRATRKILKYEEVGSSYGADHWKTLLYPLSLLLIAQKAYNKLHDPEWIHLIHTKQAMENEESSLESIPVPTHQPISDNSIPAVQPSDNTSLATLETNPILPRNLLSFHKTDGDGNCLFHAVSYLLQSLDWPTITYSIIREDIVPWLLNNSHTYVPTQDPSPLYLLADTLTYDANDNPNWDQYVQHISTEPTYAEQPQLWAIASVYQLRIHIYSTREYPTAVPITSNYTHTIYLHYDPETQHYSSLIPPTNQDTQHHPSLSTTTTHDTTHYASSSSTTSPDSPDHSLQLPIHQLQLIASFSSHLTAINYLQSQILQHQQWIQHQLNHLRLLESDQPKLQVFSTILPLDLQQYTCVGDDTYSPEFGIIELHHMLFYTPSIGLSIIRTSENIDTIQIRYISGCADYNKFSHSTITSFLTNNPKVCLITTTGINIYQIPEEHAIQVILQIQPHQQPSPSNIGNNKRPFQEESTTTEHIVKEYKTSEHRRKIQRKSYHKTKIPLLQKLKDKRDRKGIIHLLNENPTLDIEDLIQKQTTTSTPLSLSIPPTTSKSWTEVLNYNESYKHRTYNTKRKREELLATQNPPSLEGTKDYNSTEARKKRKRANYDRNRDTILDNNKLYKQNKRSSIPTPSSTLIPTDPTPTPSSTLILTAVDTTANTNIPSNKRKFEIPPPTTTSIADYFTKKKKLNEDDKPP